MPRKFAWLAWGVLSCLLSTANAQPAKPAPEPGDDVYRPKVGQSGKNVIWVPTPDSLVKRMLLAAKTTSVDVVYDLGSGDGKIPIAAARDFNARAVGIEYNPELAALAGRNAQRAGVADRVKMIAGDIFENDFSEATVVTLYLLPHLNHRLRPQILKMKPGTRVVSHAFDMRDWEPDESFTEDARQGFLWIVPATVSGRWLLSETDGTWKGALDVTQAFQRAGGTVTVEGKALPMLSPTLSGTSFAFSFVNVDGSFRAIRGRVDGDRFEGAMYLEGAEFPVSGQRTAQAPRAF